MSVTESKMAWGDFSIPFRKDTPREILNRLKLDPAPGSPYGSAFGLIRIFPHRINPDVVKTTRSKDMFAGVITDQSDPFSVQGHHVTMLLGENSGSRDLYSEEVGPIAINTPIAHDGTTSGSVTQWVTDALNIPASAINLGAILSSAHPAGTLFGAIFIRKTPKTLLDEWICHRFGVVYQVHNDLTIDVGLPIDVWPFISPMPLAVRRGGRDLNVQGLNAVELNLTTSYKDWAARVITVIESPNTVEEAHTATNPIRNPSDGTALNWNRVITGQSASQNSGQVASDAQDQASKELANAVRSRQVTLSTKEYAIAAEGFDQTTPIKPGYLIHVYDLEAGIFDLTYQQAYQGRTVYPAQFRIESVEWPLQNGMSVFYDNRHNDGSSNVLDLTPYIDFASEGTDTTVTVGAPQKTLGQRLRLRHR